VFMGMDKITSENKYMDKKFLFQCVAEPEISGNAITVRRGTIDRDTYTGELTSQILSPKSFKIEAIGGAGKQWWVNGHNFIPDGYENEETGTTDRLDFGWGRIEISSTEEKETEYFLNVMYMNDKGKFDSVQTAELIETDKLIGGKVFDKVTLFSKENLPLKDALKFELKGGNSDVAVTGLAGGIWDVYKNGVLCESVNVSRTSGVMYFSANEGSYEIIRTTKDEAAEENPLYGGGDGTKDNPYKISSVSHFMNIAKNKNSCYILTENITLPDNYRPFEFTGSFNGNGKCIKLNLNFPAVSDVGLFSSLSEDSEVYDLNIFGSVTAYSYAGGVAGRSSATVKNCVNYADITVLSGYAGGIAGFTDSNMNTVRNCTNYGTVKTLSKEYKYAGGITGYNSSPVILCGNYGEVIAGDCAGGITGGSNDDIYGSFNRGKVTAKGKAGGITAVTDGNVLYRDCYNSGEISGEKAAGINGFKNADGGKILRCYNVGEIHSGNGISGESAEGVSSYYIFEDCYSVISGESGVVVLTEEEFKTPSKLSFDFENIWEYKEGDYPFPTLKYESKTEENPQISWSDSERNGEIITAPEEFINMDPKGTYILGADIDLSEGYEPFEFSGALYGEGHRIKLNHDYSERDYVGLFSTLKSGGLVSDVTIEGTVVGGSYTGSVAGLNNGVINNCMNYADVSNKDSGSRGGGIAGQTGADGRISHCANYGNVTGRSNYFGGITGVCNQGRIISCINYGYISTHSDGGAYGGIVGNTSNGAVEKCANFGDVKCSGSAGGIASQCAGSRATITDCFNAGDITSDGSAGGIYGVTISNAESVLRCYNAGRIRKGSTDYSDAKAIFGGSLSEDSKVTISDCFYLDFDSSKNGNYGTAVTEENMKKCESFAPFDFEDVWTMEESGYYYPHLKSLSKDKYFCYNPFKLEKPASCPQFNGELNLFALNISHEERLSMNNKDKVLCFGSVSSGTEEYVLREWGMELICKDKVYTVKADRADKFGILFYGETLKDSGCVIVPYGIYEYKGSMYKMYGNEKEAVIYED